MAVSLITDEMVEKAAAAIGASMQHGWRMWVPEARAAINAVLPDIVEACAKVADEWTVTVWGDDGDAELIANSVGPNIAAAIRALAPVRPE